MSVLVVGSINADRVLRVGHLPAAGETVLASGLARFPGGKGANQAVAAARLGAEVRFIGCVGDDEDGRAMVANLADAGVATNAVRVTRSPTGTAHITVDDDGQNAIVVSSGANAQLSPADVDRHRTLVAGATVVVTQLEVPLETVAKLVELSDRVLLNAAPARAVPAEVLARVDILVANEVEAAALTPDPSPEALLDLGPRAVVVTLGARGAQWWTRAGSGEVAAPVVRPVDTTGAGDAFVGALAAAIAAGRTLDAAVALAVDVAGRATTVAGAQLPTGLVDPAVLLA